MARGRKPKAEPLPPPKSAAERRERDLLIRAKVDLIIETERQKSLLGEKIKAANADLRRFGLKSTDVAVAKRLYELEIEDQNKSLTSMRTLFRALDIGQQFDFVSALEAQEAATEEDETDEAAAVDADATGQAEVEDSENAENKADGVTAAVAGEGGEEIKPDADHDDVGDAPATDAELDGAGHTYQAGHDVGYAGGDESENPHRKRSAAAKMWSKGWQVGASKRVAEADEAARAQVAADIGEGLVDIAEPGAPWAETDSVEGEASGAGDSGVDLAALAPIPSGTAPTVEAVAA